MRTVTVEVPEGHMVKIVKEESMQPTQKVTGGVNLNLLSLIHISEPTRPY